jgi:hypothetical protein
MTDDTSPEGGKRKRRRRTRQGCAIVEAPPETCLASITDVMASFPGVTSVTASDDGRVDVRIGMGARSGGEDVEITVGVHDDASLVCVSSAPAGKRALIDYGKNRHNVRWILTELIDAHGGRLVDAAESRNT